MINTRYLKLSGKAEVSEDIDMEKYIILAGEFDATDKTERKNEDGTIDVIYTVKPLRIMQQKEGGEKVKLKTGQKRHIAQYRAILHYFTENPGNIPYEDFYDSLEAFINSHISEIVEMWKGTHP